MPHLRTQPVSMVKFCVKKVEERTGFVRGLSMEDRKNLAARKPTGPRTTVGKLRSRTNALKHGLYARNVLSAEMRKARQRYQRRPTRLFRPTDPSSRYLIEELAADLETADRLRALEIQITADFEHQSRIQRLLDHFRPSTFPQVTAAGTGCLLDRVDDPDTAEEQDVFDVFLDRADADRENAGDVAVRFATADPAENFCASARGVL